MMIEPNVASHTKNFLGLLASYQTFNILLCRHPQLSHGGDSCVASFKPESDVSPVSHSADTYDILNGNVGINSTPFILYETL